MTINRAVMEQRHSAANSIDYFPTYPWAVRAACVHAFPTLGRYSVWEPACGEGHMAHVLKDYAREVRASDIFPHGYGEVEDFLAEGLLPPSKPDYRPDFVITNPPFNRVLEFIERGLVVARLGVWVYCRLALLETEERYEALFKHGALDQMWVYVERVPVAMGWCDPKGSSATAVGWFFFSSLTINKAPTVNFIRPCRKVLEKPEDYTLHWLPPSFRKLRAEAMLAAANDAEKLEKAERFARLVGAA